MNNKILLGKLGEDLASKFLEKKGYKIIERNFKKRYEEIDIVAIDSSEKNSVLVFVEVKTRTSSEYGSPLEAITYWKLKSLIKAAQYYKLTHKNLPDGLRIDAVSIKLGYNGKAESIEHIKNISGF